MNKIEFNFLGLKLMEPNVFLTDLILGISCLVFAYRISKLPTKHPFFSNWRRFLVIFGIGTILGGFGHAFINYLGILGKMPAWLLNAFAVYYIEYSMFSLLRKQSLYKLFTTISLIKLVVVQLLILQIGLFAKHDSSMLISMIIVIINSFIGVFFSAGFLSYEYYRRGFSRHFRRLISGVLIMIPSSAVFLFEWNLFRWFDRNDLSHLLLWLGILTFYTAIVKLQRESPELFRLSWNLQKAYVLPENRLFR